MQNGKHIKLKLYKYICMYIRENKGQQNEKREGPPYTIPRSPQFLHTNTNNPADGFSIPSPFLYHKK